MSMPKEPNSVKLIISLITGDKGILKAVLKELEDKFGGIDILSARLYFNHTDYYKDEMGDGLFRKLASFENLIKPDSLPDIKLFTNSLEDECLKENRKRMINIDPGYIAMEKTVLASCKNFSHRIYLQKGVYADLTLIYRADNFQPLEWTFPDYAENSMRRLLKGIRERYVHQLQKEAYINA
ncbi:MAG: DUF4416 family protein [Deltaproteobacteria bacterium]|nr:DUF4416 family protein [Deltaproteobacteria bacterium]